MLSGMSVTTIFTCIQIKRVALIKFILFNSVPDEFSFLKELHKQLQVDLMKFFSIYHSTST